MSSVLLENFQSCNTVNHTMNTRKKKYHQTQPGFFGLNSPFQDYPIDARGHHVNIRKKQISL